MDQDFRIVAIAEEHVAGFHAALDSVARERRYLAMLEAPSLEGTTAWIQDNIRDRVPQVVALIDDRVVGWCDVLPLSRATQAHSGVLGMGIIDSFRGKGIGIALMQAALARSREYGLTRVELTVREDNLRAKALYEKVGFVTEGVKRKAALHDGVYHDLILMGLLF